MLYCSTLQAISFIVQLTDCYYKKNKYGGSIAEIYPHTLHQHFPRLGLEHFNSIHQEALKEASYHVAKSVFDLCDVFNIQKECTIYINNQAWGGWILSEHQIFEDRFYVKVVKSKQK